MTCESRTAYPQNIHQTHGEASADMIEKPVIKLLEMI